MSSKKFFKDVDPAWVGVIHFVAYLYGAWAAGSMIHGVLHSADRGGAGGLVLVMVAIAIGIAVCVVAILILHLLFNIITGNLHRTVLVAAALTALAIGYGFPGIAHLIIATSFAVYAYRTKSQEGQDKEDLRNFN